MEIILAGSIAFLCFGAGFIGIAFGIIILHDQFRR